MKRNAILFACLAGVSLICSSSAFAHPGHPAHDFTTGLAHPFTGIDHILAMLAIGLWAGQCGGRAIWAIPAAFVGAMLAGGMLGFASGISHPLVEGGIAASVLVLGLLVATARKLPLIVGVLLSVVFALCHGFAHGAELAAGSSALTYSAGFLLATATLHAVGLSISIWKNESVMEKLVRSAGVVIAISAVPVWLGLF